MDDLVYGHATAKKALKALINRARKRYYNKCVKRLEVKQEPLKCLLVGPSGTGKTHLVNALQQTYDFPLIKLDATQLSPAGCDKGITSEELKKKINKKISSSVDDVRYFSAEGVLNQLVIYVDEFDKLGRSFESSGSWNQHVQSNFLTLIDSKHEFYGISWIFSGAFSNIESEKRSPGFFSEPESKHRTVDDRAILSAGIIPELLGRINLIVELDNFTKQDYLNILKEKLLPNYPYLTNVDEATIVDKAYLSGQGIRSMTRQLEMLSIEVESDEILPELTAINRKI